MISKQNKIIIILSFFIAELSFACISFPKKLKLSESSFQDQVFTLPETEYGVAFHQGDDLIFFNQESKQWCVIQNKSLDSEPTCLKDKTVFHLTDENDGPSKGQVIGRFEVSGEHLYLFSATKDKVKDTKKPYFKFTNTSQVEADKKVKSSLLIEAISFSKGQIGSYEIEAKSFGTLKPGGKLITPKFRSVESGAPQDVLDVNRSSIKAQAGCSGKVDSTSYSKDSGSFELPADRAK